MDKLKMHSLNKVDENIEKIGKLFPNCITERKGENGKVEHAIDFDMLKQELSSVVVEGSEERYQFTWPGKRESVLLANAPITRTLRPCREESVDFDNTENLYIEGDNLEVLKLLQETYLGKVKMIYIDPPYNTGHDFVYEDNFAQSTDEYLENSGQFDDEGNRLFQNTESNGRFHTDWLNMIYPRLKLAKDLLADDGVFFISIDDNEVAQLRKICDEVFGTGNFEGHIHWRRRHNQPNDKTKMIGIVCEHILAYAKNSSYLKEVGVGKLDLTASFSNPDNDPRGCWASKPWKVGSDQSGSKYTIVTPTGKTLEGEWMGEEETYKRFLEDGRIYFPKGGDGMPRKKYYQFEREEEGQCATNWWTHEQFGHNQGANDYATALFGVKNIFSNPKPIELIKALLKIGNVKNEDIVLDFFSGSATTADSTMQLNAEDGGNRKYIMVQTTKNEDGYEKTNAYRSGFKNICEIGKERIRRAGKKIIEDNKDKEGIENLDIGFRVLKCTSSNMKEVYYTPSEYEQVTLGQLLDNIKEGRTPEDLLFQVMLELGVLLSSKIEERIIAGKRIFNVADGFLMACFDESITEETIMAIAQEKPYYFVTRDHSMATDGVSTNFDQLFAAHSPETVRKVL